MRKGERTKSRILDAAKQLFQRQGYHATGLKQILSESKAPKGSFYFHFPGGKEELASRAIECSSSVLSEQASAILERAASFSEAVEMACELLAQELEASGFENGCPVASLTMDMAAYSEPIQEACAGYYSRWILLLEGLLAHFGVAPEEHRGLATFILSAVEGALLLSQAHHSTEPLYTAARYLGQFIEQTGD